MREAKRVNNPIGQGGTPETQDSNGGNHLPPGLVTDSRILTVAEIADLLKVSKKTIYKLASHGKIPHKKIGNKIRFLLPEVITWLKGQDYV